MDRILTDQGVTESERLDVLVEIQSIVNGAVAQARSNVIQAPMPQIEVSLAAPPAQTGAVQSDPSIPVAQSSLPGPPR